jgi:acetolactate synthase-1/2/3 large subunit
MKVYDNAETIIDVFNAYGVEHLFFNPGIDNVPVLETVSKYRAAGKQSPRGILCLDEFVTLTAAHGNYMASGKPQAVSIHSELGTLQIGGSLQNAQWGKVPAIIFAEIQGPTGRVNWRQEPFDQGGMVRNFVKWEHQLTDKEDIHDALQVALNIATTEPYGPVYLAVPREVLWHKADKSSEKPKTLKKSSTQMKEVDPAILDRAADILINAENPLIITRHSGRNLGTVPKLIERAETLCARVLSSDTRMNFPNTHPLAAYMAVNAGFGDSFLTDADTILVIDYDLPYAAPPMKPSPEAKIVHIDIDILKSGAPLWGRKADIAIEGDSRQAIPALTRAINQKLTDDRRAQLQERFKQLEAEHNNLAGEWQSLAESHSQKKPISANWLSRCISEAIDDDTIIVNQTISPSRIVAHLVQRSKPGTLLSYSGGCIGWALGAALGVKLAAPDKTVVSLMGDGAFIYGCPESSLWSSGFYKAPFLSIIFDNQGYGAIKGLFREKHDVDNMGADIYAAPDYAKIAEACHAYGRTVEEPADITPALKEGLERVRSGQPAVLDIRLEPV